MVMNTPVCKYFLTNSCKFGDRCRFSHSTPADNYRSNPYVYDARQKSDGVSVMQRISSPQSVNPHKFDELDKLLPEYLKKISEDINQIEHHQLWPLTCYSFAKSQGNFPGWNDVSMEEVRWEAYQAQLNGTMPTYLANMQALLDKAKEQRGIFLRHTKMGEAFVREYMKNSNNNSTPQNQNVSFVMNNPYKTQSNFSFASALEKPTTFGQVSTPNTSGFFSQNVPNVFNQFQPSQSQEHSFFGNKSFDAPQTSGDIFSSTQRDFSSNMEVGGGNAFSFSSNQSFGADQNSIFGGNKFTQSPTTSVNVTVYSKIEDLAPEELEAFKANTFSLENLPFAPPPKELCH